MSDVIYALGTPDICDQYGADIQVALPIFKSYGGLTRMTGVIETLKIDQNNAKFWELLRTPGKQRILVVDAGADIGAVMGDKMADLAVKNGWKGVVINGYIRDTAILQTLPLGVWALGHYPKKGSRLTEAQHNVPLTFADMTLMPTDTLYADEDGLLVTPHSFPEFENYFH
ncbi:ribonuclease E activity regulator RraA [Thiosulfativibrio zosterae]|uniref:4-hydroxy-4-methyl-2-oxoglutarate aldolase n=1 Tax=Thiosulfativibrio zosterae TaxID=2675053 RepID=A0A6F8PP64_9GAMM|nr:ribonuclease E activity regulator RraA [Thiosulfativibrio zosterae]BBP43909.1 putative 4-hydroxy-4-methyl-2-oxoglutarate aldolase [Thiosulfativibrio zosterae]